MIILIAISYYQYCYYYYNSNFFKIVHLVIVITCTALY